jgi:hypothetical protein
MSSDMSGLSHRSAGIQLKLRVINHTTQMFLRLGGAFVMSDDSHGVDQIGTNYARLLAFIGETGIDEMHFVDRTGIQSDSRFPNAGFLSIAVSELSELPFWKDAKLSRDAIP